MNSTRNKKNVPVQQELPGMPPSRNNENSDALIEALVTSLIGVLSEATRCLPSSQLSREQVAAFNLGILVMVALTRLELSVMGSLSSNTAALVKTLSFSFKAFWRTMLGEDVTAIRVLVPDGRSVLVDPEVFD